MTTRICCRRRCAACCRARAPGRAISRRCRSCGAWCAASRGNGARRHPTRCRTAATPAGEERRAIAGLDVAKIIALFDDDPAAQAIMRGMMEGARGAELQELSGLDKTDYESKRTKIRRRIEKLWAMP